MTEPKKSIADGLDAKVNPYDESFGANAERALQKTPFVGKAYNSIRSGVEGVSEADDIGDAAKSMVASGGSFIAGCYADAAFAAMDPIGWLVGNGLNMLLELVQPLQDALHYVTGDGPSLEHASGNFAQIGEGFVALAEDFIDTGDKSLVDWKEDAGNAAREALADFSVGIKGVGSAAGGVSEVLKTWSMVMIVIEEVVKAIITELVSWLITLWLPALAASIISFGSSVAAAMTASIAKAASVFAKVTKHLGKLGKLLDEFMQFLIKFNDKVVKIAEKFRVGKTVAKGQKSIPIVGKPSDVTKFVPSRRVATTTAGAMAKGMDNVAGNFEQRIATTFSKEALGAFGVGAGIKSGIGVAKAGGQEAKKAKEEYLDEDDTPLYDRSQIGGDQSAEDTRKNLDM